MGKKKLWSDPQFVAKTALALKGVLRWYNDRYYRFKGRNWEEISPAILAHEIRKTLPPDIQNMVPEGALLWLWSTIKSEFLLESGKVKVLPCHVNGLNVKGWMSLSNGIIDFRADIPVLMQHNPDFFNLNCCDYAYNPAATCPNWLEFLAQVYENDPERIALLQEWFGYVLSNKNDQNKVLVMHGVKRGGKSTILNVLTELVGLDAYTAFSITDMTGKHANAMFVGKTLAACSEFDIVGKWNSFYERLKSHVGVDLMLVDEKFQKVYTTRPTHRIMILTNDIPQIDDPHGVIASKFLILDHNKSFFGNEDKELFNKLKSELPGILNWAKEGYIRLEARGWFSNCTSSKLSINELAKFNDPSSVWIGDNLELVEGESCDADDVYQVYKNWAESGNERVLNRSYFGRYLVKYFKNTGFAYNRNTKKFEGVKFKGNLNFLA